MDECRISGKEVNAARSKPTSKLADSGGILNGCLVVSLRFRVYSSDAQT